MRSLGTRATLNTTKFLAVVAVVLFVSAGTLRFWQAWMYLALNLAWLAVAGVYFLRRDPALVERRLVQDEQGEKEKAQKVVMAILRVLGAATLVVAGLDRRFGWSTVPPALVVAGAVVFVAGTALIFVVFLENTFTSSIIEVDRRQTVVTTGPYRALRHPMYTGTLLMGVATPLVLGSYWAALLLPLGWALLAVRILAEERLLSEKLRGYGEYMQRTRSRLIPGVW
jgi:protein-S-isoprenylcysteine O-methyltransferase Ste14